MAESMVDQEGRKPMEEPLYAVDAKAIERMQLLHDVAVAAFFVNHEAGSGNPSDEAGIYFTGKLDQTLKALQKQGWTPNSRFVKLGECGTKGN